MSTKKKHFSRSTNRKLFFFFRSFFIFVFAPSPSHKVKNRFSLLPILPYSSYSLPINIYYYLLHPPTTPSPPPLHHPHYFGLPRFHIHHYHLSRTRKFWHRHKSHHHWHSLRIYYFHQFRIIFLLITNNI